MEQMLDLDADTRITATEALAHPYLAQYADPTDEPTAEPYDQSFEEMELTIPEWKGWFSCDIISVAYYTCTASFLQNIFIFINIFFSESINFSLYIRVLKKTQCIVLDFFT